MRKKKIEKKSQIKFKKHAQYSITSFLFLVLVACQPRVPKALPQIVSDDATLACLEKIAHPLPSSDEFLSHVDIKIREKGRAFNMNGRAAFRKTHDFYAEFDGFGVPAAAVLINKDDFTLLLTHEQKAFRGSARQGFSKFLHMSLSLSDVVALMEGQSPKNLQLNMETFKQNGKNTFVSALVIEPLGTYLSELEIDTQACRLVRATNLFNQQDVTRFSPMKNTLRFSDFDLTYGSYFISWKVSRIQVKVPLQEAIFELNVPSNVNISSIDEM